MFDEKARELIALKKFSLIAPVLNGQVENQEEYFKQLAIKPVEMPHYGMKRYTVKTLQWWLYLYRQHGLEGLKPGHRSDRGKSRRVTDEIALKIQEKIQDNPRLKASLIYEELVKNGVFTPDKLSLATFYRYLAQHPELAAGRSPEEQEKEIRRFAHQWINELWQTDIMHGPYLKVGRAKKQTYLIAFIDDASRLITHGQFCWEQNFNAVRTVLKEAVLRRGVPKMLYTDNGKVYRCGQLAFICAALGCTLLHAEPFTPNSKGKIERFFLTVRTRFLSQLDVSVIKNLDELNRLFWQWLDTDYQRKLHRSLNMSPLDYFMAQADRVNMFAEPALLDEYFLLRTNRKVNHDATFSLEGKLYETNQQFAGTRLEVRYEPEWLINPARPVLLYKDGLKVGEARQVNYFANAGLKRKRSGRNMPENQDIAGPEGEARIGSNEVPAPAISFAGMLAENKPAGAGEL